MSVLIEKNVECKTRDGTILRADIYRPAEDGRFPALVLRTPYNKELSLFTHGTLDPVRAASAGYVVVLQDVRSRFASDGDVFFPYRNEFEDGFDTIEWAAGLPYCDGNVGAYGVSYMGATPWHAAASAPGSLKAISPTQAPNDQFINLSWRGGAFLWGTNVVWSVATIGPLAFIRAKSGSADFLPSFLSMIDDIDEYERLVKHTPPVTLPAARPDDPSCIPFLTETMKHSTRDDFYQTRTTYDLHSQIKAPALIIAGWYDLLLGADLEHFAQMKSEAATDEAMEKTKIIIGPWAHGAFLNVVGELDFGVRTSGLFLDLKEDLTGLNLRWFDRWLKGTRNGIDEEPRVKLFVMGLNRWRDESDWPLERAVETPWYFQPEGRLAPTAPGADETPDSYLYDPQDPCPTRGGNLLLPRTYVPGPVVQNPLLSRRDVLTYTSEFLTEDLEVTGPVKAIVYASTSASDTDWVVKLCDVHPDGRTFNVCDGILRASYRNSNERRDLVEPGAVERYEIDLWATSNLFKAGHRVCVLVTSSDFPRYDRNPNTGELGVEATKFEPAMQRIFHDSQRASHILIPVVD